MKKSVTVVLGCLLGICIIGIGIMAVALFADNKLSGNNIVQSANLDVEFEYSHDLENWGPVEQSTTIFNPEALYVPGYSETVYLRVVNKGSSAISYAVSVIINSETGSTNVLGDSFKLSDHMVFSVRDITNESKDIVNSRKITDYKFSGALDPAAESLTPTVILEMIISMPDSVGNEANYATESAIPTIGLGLQLTATQKMDVSDPTMNTLDAALNVDGGTLTFTIADGSNGENSIYPWEVFKTYARSANADHDGTTAIISTTVDMEAGDKLEFKWKASCEALNSDSTAGDKCEFTVNDYVKATITGETNWQTYSFEADKAGSYTFKWIYTKDSAQSTSAGDDCAYLDDVQLIKAGSAA